MKDRLSMLAVVVWAVALALASAFAAHASYAILWLPALVFAAIGLYLSVCIARPDLVGIRLPKIAAPNPADAHEPFPHDWYASP